MEDNKIVSKRLKEAMQLRKIKQAEIALKTNIPKSSISSYLSGKYVPKQTNIYKLSKILNVSPVWLMGLDVPRDVFYDYDNIELDAESNKIDEFLFNIKYEDINKIVEENKDKVLDLLDKETIMIMIAEKQKGKNIYIEENNKFKETNKKIFEILKKENPNLENYNYYSDEFIDYIYNKTLKSSIKKTAFCGYVQNLCSIQELSKEILNRGLFLFDDNLNKSEQEKINSIIQICNTLYENILNKKRE